MSVERPDNDAGQAVERLLERLPTVLAHPLDAFLREGHPVMRLHRLCDAVEIVTRFCTIVALAELRGRLAGQEWPRGLVNTLREHLARPTFGSWRNILASALKEIEEFDKQPSTAPLADQEWPRGLVNTHREHLARPTFGSWRNILASALKEIKGLFKRPTSAPQVAPSVLDFARTRLEPRIAAGQNQPPENSLIALRNLLAHGGPMSEVRARYYLDGEAASATDRFAGWELPCLKLFGALDAITDCQVGFHQSGSLRLLHGVQPTTQPTELSAELRLTFQDLNEHVLLLREGRGLDLWPMCDFGRAQMPTHRGIETAKSEGPLLYIRAEPDRLLYAALGAELPYGERPDVVAEFNKLFQLNRPKEADPSLTGYEHELPVEANEFLGRETELEQVKAAVRATEAGVLWVSGPPGIGKSCLMARAACDVSQELPGWCRIFWRFKAGDTSRCHRYAFFQHAIRRLADWLKRTDVVPAREFVQLEAQFFDLLAVAAQRAAAVPDASARVLFVLDGLDEIARTDASFVRVPVQRPQPGVVWLCAGRPDPEVLAVFTPTACRAVFPAGLPPMSADEIRGMVLLGVEQLKYDLLRLDQAATAEATPTNAAIKALVERAAGLPMYVRLAIEDVRARRLRFDEFANRLPGSLKDYWNDLLERLGADDVQAVLPMLVASVVAAKEAIDVETLFRLLVRYKIVEDSAEGSDTVRRGLDMVRSLVRATDSTDAPGRGYEPIHPSFREHVLSHTQQKLNQQSRLAREQFIQAGRDWSQVPSGHSARRYVLRHRAEHLADLCRSPVGVTDERRAEARAELFDVARDRAFFQAQRQELPQTPQLPLESVRLALDVAAEADDAVRMAEFVLLHAERVQEIGQQSPLDALRAGNLEGAWQLADLADPERRVVWHLLLEWELKDTGRLEEAERTRARLFVAETPKLSGELAKTAVPIAARVVEDRAEEYGLIERLFQADDDRLAVVRELVALGKLKLALQTARAIDHDWWRAHALGQIAAAQAQAGDADGARQTFATALQTARAIDHAMLRAEVLRAIAAAQAQAGDTEGALQTARAIDDARTRPGALGTIAAAQAQIRDFQEALQTARGIETGWERAKALLEIATAQAKAGIFDEALTTARAIEDARKRAEVLRAIAAGQAQAGDTERARRSFAEALQTPRAIDHARLRADALRDIAAAQAQVGDFPEALQTARAILDVRDRAETLCQIAAAQAQAGNVPAALHTARAIEDDWRRAAALCQIAAAQAQAGEIGPARRSFAEARQTARAIDDARTRPGALGAIAAAQAQIGDFQEALQTAHAIDHVRLRADALREIAAAQVKAGIFHEALTTAHAIEDDRRRAAALCQVAAGQARAGDTGPARGTFAEARQTAHAIENEWERAEALRQIAAAQAQVGDFQEALQTAREIEDADGRARALWQIAPAQAQAGDADGARQTARAIDDDWQRAQALRQIAAAQAQAGDADGARQTFAEALRTARAIDGDYSSAMALQWIAAAMAEAGDAESARGTFAEALQTARAIDDDVPGLRAGALWQIAAAQAQAGDADGARQAFVEALQTVRAIDDDRRRAEELAEIAAALAEQGFGGEAVAIVPEILVDRPAALEVIAAALVARQDRPHFKRLLPMCGHHPTSAYRACGLIAQLDPLAAAAIAQLVVGPGTADASP